MSIVINPGSGPVEGATEENATLNIEQFVADLKGGGIRTIVTWTREPRDDDGDGRYNFNLIADNRDVIEIEMPGLPIERVRWVDPETQDIWDFPRLYVDGSSWVWKYALVACKYYPPEDD